MFRICVKRTATAAISRALEATLVISLLLFAVGCAPKLYSVNVSYRSSASTSPIAGSGQKSVITVASFNDVRPGGKDLLVGRVTTAMGGIISVIPKNMPPSTAVSAIVKDVLVQSGDQVSVIMPDWNLKENTIRQDWGDIIVGGNIEELEIACQNDIPIKTYEARVKLTMVIADVQTGRILHQFSTTSKNSLEHIYFSEEMLGQQISSAITEAAEKAFEGNVLKKIKGALKKPAS